MRFLIAVLKNNNFRKFHVKIRKDNKAALLKLMNFLSSEATKRVFMLELNYLKKSVDVQQPEKILPAKDKWNKIFLLEN